ncbi:MAG: hypothetical protein KC996_01755 [Phycisphaerales bacterium]|nr:hypothetical protein [Phycisphaerales bacterium]
MIGFVRRITGPGAGGQLWRRAWFASALVVIACMITHVHSTRLVPKSTDDVLALAFEQRVLTQRVVKGALMLDASVSQEQYDAISPSIESLRADAEGWLRTHERLVELAGTGIEEPIARMSNPHAQLSRGIGELILVGSSAERRAPYLDRETEGRIARACVLVRESEAHYAEGLERITEQRLGMIDARIDAFRSASRSGLVFVIALVLVVPPILVLPVLGLLKQGGGGSAGVIGRIGDTQAGGTQQQPGVERRAA